jgi:hypothetical protein
MDTKGSTSDKGDLQNLQNSQQPCRFLLLPRELREMIYNEYLAVPGGYAYDELNNRLVRADDKPRDGRDAYAKKQNHLPEPS